MDDSSAPLDPLPGSDLRLARVLKERATAEGGFSALARAVSRANGVDTGSDVRGRREKDVIDRRKLRSLAEARDDVLLSIADMRALDRYLERFGEGLGYFPLFERPDLMQTLAESGRVTFLLGSKVLRDVEVEKDRWVISRFDVLAMAELQRGINASGVSVHFDIQEAIMQDDLRVVREAIEAREWKELFGDRGPSLVCLASSRTNPGAESMLAHMFDREPFADAPLERRRRLPFQFVWNPELPFVFPSHFLLRPEEIASVHPDAADLVRRGKASAVSVGDEVLVDRVTPRGWGDTYGLVAAQRRRRGQVWLLVAGVTGAATFAAARLAKKLSTRLHEENRGEDSNVHWALVRARVGQDQAAHLGSLREFELEDIHTGPNVWRRSLS